MSCTVSPASSTTPQELRDTRQSLSTLRSSIEARRSARVQASRNMSYRGVSIASPTRHRSVTLTLPLTLAAPASKLDTSGNKMAYTLNTGQRFTLTPVLPTEYVSVSADYTRFVLYSKEQQESGQAVRYATVISPSVSEMTVPTLSEPARPESIPLCRLDAEFNKSLPTTSLSNVEGVASETANTITLTFFRSVAGGPFTPHTVSTYGWNVSSKTDAGKLLLNALPALDDSLSYPVEEAAPFGRYYKTCRPAGFKREWARVATKEYSIYTMETEIPRAVDICAQSLGLQDYGDLKSGIVNGSTVTLRYESGAILYLPSNRFEIRPQEGYSLHRKNVVDPGPFPRKARRKRINAGYRPVGTKYYSAGGNYQYVQETWEEYSKRYAAMFGVTSGFKWLWEAPPQAQAWYQAAYATENFYNYTRAVRDVFPTFYYAIMIHANNIGNAMAFNYFKRAVPAIEAERAQNPNYGRRDAHLTCKRIYEQKAWLILKHRAYMNKVCATLQRELPRRDPILFPNDASLYPRPL